MKKVPFFLLVAILMLSVGFTFAATPQKSIKGNLKPNVVTRVPAPTAPNVVLYDQYDNATGAAYTSQDFETAFDAYDNQAADDFVVPTGETWNIDEVDVQGQYSTGGPAAAFHVFIYSDAGGLPGTNVYTALDQPYSDGGTGTDFVITLATPAVLTEGTYWVSVQSRQDFGTAGQWFWNDRSVQSGSPAAWQNPGGGFGTGCSTWGVRSTCIGGAPDHIYRIAGTLGPACAYADDFNDGVLTWTEVKPIVTEAGGVLSLVPAPGKRVAFATSDPAFTGCQNCTNTFTDVIMGGGILSKTFIDSHFIDKKNLIQLVVKQDLGRAVLKVRVGGVIVAKGKVLMTFDPNVAYDFAISYDGTNVVASVDGVAIITLTPPVAVPAGTAAVQTRGQSTTVDSFCSN